MSSLLREWWKVKHTAIQVKKTQSCLSHMNRREAATALRFTIMWEQQKSHGFSYVIGPFWQLGLLVLFSLEKKKKKMDKGKNSALFPIAAQGVEHRLRKEKPHRSRGVEPTSLLSQGSTLTPMDLGVMWKLQFWGNPYKTGRARRWTNREDLGFYSHFFDCVFLSCSWT